MDEDYYQALGLSRGASDDEIQKAYRTLAGKFHPDLNPDDRTAKAKFQAVQRAYEVLSDPKSREMYDRYGRTFDSAAPNGPGGGTWRHAGSGGTVDFDFSQFFGEGASGGGVEDILRHFTQAASPQSRAASAGPAASASANDLQYRITVPFNTAVTGGEHRLQLKRPDGSSETVSVKIPPGSRTARKFACVVKVRNRNGAASPVI